MKYGIIKQACIMVCVLGLTLAGCGAVDDGTHANASGEPLVLSQLREEEPQILLSQGGGSEVSSGKEGMDSAQGQRDSFATGKRAVMLDGKLYVETGETNSMLRCGMMDGIITSSTDGELPTVDNQSNFGKDISYQRGMRENRIEILLEEQWRIFAYNENNLKDVGFDLKDVTAETGTLVIHNDTGKELNYGSYFSVEQMDLQTGEWMPVQGRNDMAFCDIGYVAGKEESTWQADWGNFYGTLLPGTYRLVKEFWVYGQGAEDDSLNGSSGKYTMMFKFDIK